MWDKYADDVKDQIVTWLVEDGLPEDEARGHADYIAKSPPPFHVPIRDGTVLNYMKRNAVGDGQVAVWEIKTKHEGYGFWMYVDTSQGKKFFGLCNMPETSTGHLLLIKAEAE